MGGVGSIDSCTQDRIKDVIKVVLNSFLDEYQKAYGKALLHHARIKDEERKRDELVAASKVPLTVSPLVNTRRLSQRPDFISKWPLMEGKLTKQGAIHRSWKERYFVVRPDYCVDYFETQEGYKSAHRPKGTVVPCGYSVLDREARVAYLSHLASKMNCDDEDLPGVQLPPHTFEVHHDHRRCYYVTAANKADKLRWMDVFRHCAYNNTNYSSTDPVAVEAFEVAITRCRRQLGRWGTWPHGGTEQEILCDLVLDDLEENMLGDIYLTLKGSIQNKFKLRQQLMSKLLAWVTEQVVMVLDRMAAIASMLRKDCGPLLTESIFAVDVTDREMTGQLRELADNLLIPWIGENVIPVLPDLIRVLVRKVDAAVSEARYLFDSKVAGLFDAVRAEPSTMVTKHQALLDSLSFNFDEVRRIFEKLCELEEPLIGFRASFSDLQPWTVIFCAQSCVVKVLDDACFSYRERVMAAINAGNVGGNGYAPVEKARLKEIMLVNNRDLLEMLDDDSATAATQFYEATCLSIIKPPLMKTIYPVVKPVTDSLNSSIPDSFRSVLFAEDLFEALADGLICRRVEVALDAISHR